MTDASRDPLAGYQPPIQHVPGWQPPAPPAPPAPRVPLPPAPAPGARRRPRWATPLAVAGSLVVGLGIGAAVAASSDPTTSEQYQALAAQLRTAKADADAAGQQMASAQDAADTAVDEATQARTDADAREKKLDSREAALDTREKALDKREDAVEGKEKKAKASEIEDGTWTVGVDIAAGTYKIKDKIESICYWAIVRSGSNGEDIIANDLPTGGYPSVTLTKGQDFENQCGTWKKVG